MESSVFHTPIMNLTRAGKIDLEVFRKVWKKSSAEQKCKPTHSVLGLTCPSTAVSGEWTADLSAIVLSSRLLCLHSPGHLTVGNYSHFPKTDKMHFQTARHCANALVDTWQSEYGCKSSARY